MEQKMISFDTNLTNEQLMHLWYEGHDQAFDILTARVWETLFRRAYRQLPTRTSSRREKAEDLTQDALIKAMCTRGKSAARWKPERGSVLTWLKAILRNEVTNQLRRRTGQEALMSDLAVEYQEGKAESFESQIPDHCLPVEQEVQAQEHAQRVQGWLAALGEQEWAIFTMRVKEGKTYKEIGQVLGCSTATAYRRVRDLHANLETTST